MKDLMISIENCQKIIQATISKTTPLLLSATAGKAKCCIFKVSNTFIGNSYQPSVVSIGPYHHGKPNLKMIEEHKWRYLGSLLSRTKEKSGKTLSDYLLSIKPLEADAKECYSETIQLESDKFLEMMVLDGCFILEIFLKVNNPQLFEHDDPLNTMAWILPSLYRDFLRLENQIPFFILEKLFEISKLTDHKLESGTTLSLLALQFFNRIMLRPLKVIEKCGRKLGGKHLHLLDLVHSSYTYELKIPSPIKVTETPIIHCISKLRRSGIKLNQVKDQEISFLAVKFKNGAIEMPTLTIDVFMTSFLLNCLALEQHHYYISKHFTAYATLLDCLVESNKDIGYLCDCNVVKNDYGTDAEVAHFINTMGKDVVFDIDQSYLSELFKDVDKYYQKCWNVQWTGFKQKYFNSPWSFISALAASVALVLTFAQTFYAIYGYVHPQ
ncbi:hypothetical protein I3760_10G130300 [Carya illinoinensis]|uniref:Uncharacterized protein n=1 Tax=Carya illinoinensis TaxID=32201 RepID=A0A8T1P7D3_CARIL|nr:UPF0481 protein At3g47200-like [Carya illinoinensis]KAG2685539.1 hypothetical protein I3760_10G130300 [Carya illinoinensis]KAG6639869.1 hypothetical protein CIPAW_10G132100 [Carya illinoinensis]